jgi:hypothetical protein
VTVVATAKAPQLRFRLPGKWWQIPLGDLDEAKASVRRLVDVAVGPRDDRAIERDRMRSQLFTAVEKAVAGSGLSMQIALEIVEGLPIPASFTVFQPDLSLSPAVGTGGAAVMGILQQGLEKRPDFDPEAILRFRSGVSEVLRQHRTEIALVTDRDTPEELETLAVEYWMTVPNAKRVLLVSFSTALAGIDHIMLPFFDSIIGATYWAGLDADGADEQPEAAQSEPATP